LAESCPSLREYILSTCHSLLGHLGFRKTLEYARRFFWWRTMRDDADAFVRTCETCARIKPSTQAPAGLLHSLPVPSRPWQGIAVDFIGPLPEGEYRGMIYDTIMTVTCLFTKEVRLVRFRSDFTAKDLAQFFFDDVYCHKLFPEYIVSDRDKLFTSSFWSELSHLLGIELRRSTAYHPQTDGSSERTNRTVKQTLQAFVEYAQPNWPHCLTAVEVALKLAVNDSTGMSPFELAHGYLSSPFPSAFSTSVSRSAEEFLDSLHFSWLTATDAVIGARLSQAIQANRHRREDPPALQVGHKAYLSTKDLNLPEWLSSKFLPRFVGPYPITRHWPETSNYELQLPSSMKIHNIFHVEKLRPHFPNDDLLFPGRTFPEPPALDVDGEAEFEVDRVVWWRIWQGRREFLVRWRGYGPLEDTWENEAELRVHASKIVDDFCLSNQLPLSYSRSSSRRSRPSRPLPVTSVHRRRR
jgi:hypothetical protein